MWSPKKTIYRGELPKKVGRGVGQFADLREGAWQKRGNALYVDYYLSIYLSIYLIRESTNKTIFVK